MAEPKIVVMEFTKQQLFDLDAMVTEGFRAVRDGATEEQRAAGLAIVRRIDDNRRALVDGKRPPDAAADRPTRTDLICRIDDALSWIDEPDDLTPEQQLAKIRAVLDDGEKRPSKSIVVDFCAERAEYVRTLRQCTDDSPDYHRWQGHAESRRQLSERLGLPVAWPAEDKRQTAEAQATSAQPRGEGAYLLEGDDEIFTEVPRGE